MCTTGEDCVIYEKQAPLATLHLAPVVGYGRNSMVVPKHPYLSNETFIDDWGITPGLLLKITLPRLNENLSFLLQSTYGTSAFYISHSAYGRSSEDIVAERQFISTLFGMRYAFPKGKARPLFSGGLVMDYSMDFEIYESMDVIIVPPGGVIPDIIPVAASSATGFFLETGIEIHTRNRHLLDLVMRYNFMISGIDKMLDHGGSRILEGSYGIHLKAFTLGTAFYLF
jgi:hypothetical protein